MNNIPETNHTGGGRAIGCFTIIGIIIYFVVKLPS